MSLYEIAPPSVQATFDRSLFTDFDTWILGLALASAVLSGRRAPALAVLDYIGAVEWAWRDLPDSFANLLELTLSGG